MIGMLIVYVVANSLIVTAQEETFVKHGNNGPVSCNLTTHFISL